MLCDACKQPQGVHTLVFSVYALHFVRNSVGTHCWLVYGGSTLSSVMSTVMLWKFVMGRSPGVAVLQLPQKCNSVTVTSVKLVACAVNKQCCYFIILVK